MLSAKATGENVSPDVSPTGWIYDKLIRIPTASAEADIGAFWNRGGSGSWVYTWDMK